MSLQTLQSQIEDAFKIVATSENKDAKRQEFTNILAKAIDAYVQEQIGIRLNEILTSIVVPVPGIDGGTSSISPTAGRDFRTFTRQK